jgi:three-Cys-motif partner protein
VPIPSEYQGREATYLKHRVLTEYLGAWAHKQGSRSRFRSTRLWYVDCFAGPWRSADQDLRDTSVHIGLEALRRAAATWSEKGHTVDLAAVFVEKDAKKFAALEAYLDKEHGAIEVVPLNCEFGEGVDAINGRIGRDPAFFFVDPTGWKGAAMKYIAPLVSIQNRDVLINVMFNDINRFKDDPRAFLREQLCDFFGLKEGAIPTGLEEDALFHLYRHQLREKCRVPLAADLAIPHPTHERTWFRLAVGGHHPAIVELFRQVERRVCGEEAREVRMEAKRRGDAQLHLGLPTQIADQSYERLHRDGLGEAPKDLLRTLKKRSPQRYLELWPGILADRHIVKSDLNRIVWELRETKHIVMQGMIARQRTPKDENLIGIGPEARS